ncbi:MAG: hypothetical protein ABSB82_06960 [Terriglobia bacterium]|jgi:hypothetical protein
MAHIFPILGWASIFVVVAVITYLEVIRPWHLRWGATGEEARQPLPGDDLVVIPRLQATHAVTINAPPAQIWPWLVQMGQGRGGLYSYDWLENLFGLNIHSADRILPEYQSLKPGDVIPLEPGGTGPPVVAVWPGHALVLGGKISGGVGGRGSPFELHDKNPESYMACSWIFFLQPVDATTTRLIERFRLDWSEGWKYTLLNRVILEPVSFIMGRKMLLGIKRRAEALAAEALTSGALTGSSSLEPTRRDAQDRPSEERKAS